MHDYADKSRGIRLQKAMADAGVASRRACEEMIEQGRVTINGQRVAQLPAWADPAEDRIEVDGQALARPRKTKASQAARAAGKVAASSSVGKTYIIVNKPRGVLCTNDDPHDRKRVIDLIDSSLAARVRLYPVGRLDADSTGMILLTNDGELTHRLTHPSYEVPKEYRVTVVGRVAVEDLDRLKKGIYLASPDAIAKTKAREGDFAKPGDEPGPGHSPKNTDAKKATVESVRILRVETDRTRGDRTLLAITLREGQNREIRRIMARLGFKVRKLKRVAIGPIRLKTLGSGNWREMTAPEVRKLRRAAKL